MEQKEKVEKPEWVNIVETLPEIVRQQIGNNCVALISSLIQLYFMHSELYDAVLSETDSMIAEYWRKVDERNNSSE